MNRNWKYGIIRGKQPVGWSSDGEENYDCENEF